jgi:hypothetical protein
MMRDLLDIVGFTLLLLVAGVIDSCSTPHLVDLGDGTIVPTVAEIEPTSEQPREGCIPVPPSEQANHAGTIAPEIVRVIGTTSLEDGQRWKVLRGPEFDPRHWLPFERDAIKFGAPCRINSPNQFDASRGAPPAPPRK